MILAQQAHVVTVGLFVVVVVCAPARSAKPRRVTRASIKTDGGELVWCEVGRGWNRRKARTGRVSMSVAFVCFCHFVNFCQFVVGTGSDAFFLFRMSDTKRILLHVGRQAGPTFIKIVNLPLYSAFIEGKPRRYGIGKAIESHGIPGLHLHEPAE